LSLTLRKEKQIRAFENEVLRRIFGHTREVIKGRCRILHDEELHNLYSSPNTMRVTKSRNIR
jgi:hypothetical protein